MLAAADDERTKAMQRLELLKRCISTTDAEMERLRQERDRAVADAQACLLPAPALCLVVMCCVLGSVCIKMIGPNGYIAPYG